MYACRYVYRDCVYHNTGIQLVETSHSANISLQQHPPQQRIIQPKMPSDTVEKSSPILNAALAPPNKA